MGSDVFGSVVSEFSLTAAGGILPPAAGYETETFPAVPSELSCDSRRSVVGTVITP